MIHTVSLSGGRTSTGHLPTEVIKAFGKESVDLIFCDTGAEHPDTYRFVRDAEDMIGKSITCLKLILPKEAGIGCDYEIATTKEIRRDYKAWKQLTSKYGNPYIPGGKFCTDQMKTQIYRKYCESKYGKGNYSTWVGYRYEEGNRIWGRDASNALGKLGLNNTEKTEFYLDCKAGRMELLLDEYYPSMFPSQSDEKEKEKIRNAFERIQQKKFHFLSELSKVDKSHVVMWWKDKPNDLSIGEHETNCMFCPEKPNAVVMLTIKDNIEAAEEFLEVVESDEVASKERKHDKTIMYRNETSFRWLLETAKKHTRDEILQMSRFGVELAKKNPCSSGECQPFNFLHEEQQDLFAE